MVPRTRAALLRLLQRAGELCADLCELRELLVVAFAQALEGYVERAAQADQIAQRFLGDGGIEVGRHGLNTPPSLLGVKGTPRQ